MHVAIVGTGLMGRVHAEAWSHTGARITAFVGKPGTGGDILAGTYGARVATELDAVLGEADVVDVCTPTHLHAEFTLRAAAAGKHVVCEKPLALTVPDGLRMIQACRTAGVRLLVAHVLRFFPEYRLARELVARGEIGVPAVLRLSRCTFRPRKADNWYVDPARSGGMILDLMVHDFDYARWVAGDVVRVFARAAQITGQADETDHALAILTHRSGAISHVEGSWAYPAPSFHTRLEIAGAAGLIEVSSPETAAVELRLHKEQDSNQEVALPGSPLQESPYATQLRVFYEALTRGTEPPVSAEDGLAAVQIARAAIDSARAGLPVELDSSGILP
ncbi:MAG: Gfo/Idh/MocA family oxidoreductase [Bacillati bacterium ANGP1]|uniref:Gfo/Idh/MocA family oxidoreductase n=1 Tax=Candidatus Segetimicrobium genomatis TaxID=2569760 RepID=A0A537LIC5_9BACT|nr:MAG: Gfo/Idh/MocA family oxidoreductase [Terrabacteria group bacterium ANGP1]TMJ13425.1 MAG: Gfo/Idh/MocA family oxidoreductase [Terrabacteria group bacterium ANGP1]